MLLFQSLKISLGAFCYIYGYGQKQIYRLLESGIRGDNPFGVVSGRASGAKYELNQTHGDHWWITEQLKVAFYSRI